MCIEPPTVGSPACCLLTCLLLLAPWGPLDTSVGRVRAGGIRTGWALITHGGARRKNPLLIVDQHGRGVGRMGLGVEPQSREVTKQGTGWSRNRGFAETGQPWGRPDGNRCSSLPVAAARAESQDRGEARRRGLAGGRGCVHVEIPRDWLVVSTRCNGRLATISPLGPASPKQITALICACNRDSDIRPDVTAWRNA